MGTMRNLNERAVDFSYGFNMNCPECNGVTGMTTEAYHREEHCAHSVPHGGRPR
jgi:hypothetical protein